MENNGVDARLSQIESVLERVNARLDEIEKRLSVPPKVENVVAQPAVEVRINPAARSVPDLEPVRPAASEERPKWAPQDYSTPTKPPVQEDRFRVEAPVPPVQTADELEYKFGINGLLRGGVIVVLCAFLFLVALFIGRGMLSPSMQFGGEITFCLALIGIGIWKREEKEDFGQLMIGLGSCGLYASFAGAHVYKHLISSEVLVGLFFVLSLLNLGIAEFWKSKSFFTIGFLGGLVTALLPMMKNNHSVDLLLHFLILVPSAIVVSRNKWAELGLAMWLLSTAALLPICTSNLPFWTRALSLHLDLVISLITFGFTGNAKKTDPTFSALPAASVVSGLLLVLIDSGKTATLQAISLAVATCVVAFLFRKNTSVRDGVLAGGLISFVLFAPMGLSQYPATAFYLVETAILLGTAIRFNQIRFASLGFLTFACGVVGYALWLEANTRRPEPLAVQKELFYFVVAAINVTFAGIFFARFNRDVAWVTASSALVAIAAKIVLLMFLPTQETGDVQTGLTANTVLAGAAILAYLGYRLKFFALSGLSALIAIGTGFMLVIDIVTFFDQILGYRSGDNQVSMPGAIPASFLAAVTFFLLRKTVIENQFFGSEIGIGVLLENFSCAALIRVALEFGVKDGGKFALIFVLSLISMLIVAMVRIVRGNTEADRWFGVFAGLILALVWVALKNTSVPLVHPIVLYLTVLTFCAFLSILYFVRNKPLSDEFAFVMSVLLAGSLICFFEPILQDEFGMRTVAAWTASLTITAALMILVGFVRDDRYLRYVSLIVFGITVLKVFMIDLAALDSMIRVAIMMVLGFAMIAGGYGYINMKKKQS